LVVLTYFVFRWRQLHHRNGVELGKAVTQERATEEARDQVVTQATSSLEANIDTLSQLTSRLPESQASTFIANGVTRFRALAIKLAAASRLRITQANDPLGEANIAQIITDALEQLHETISKRHITIDQAITATATKTRNASLLTFVIRTVIDNACAYSSDNSTVHITAKNDAEATVIAIKDSGSGIPNEKLRLLFQPFSKAEGAEIFNHEGMGFSLYLDKLIMSYLSGTISLTSKLHHGTTVTITLPNTETLR